MKYKIGIAIIFIVLCGVVSAQTTDDMEINSHKIAANVTMFIVNSVTNQQQNGMINSSSFNDITDNAVTMAINQMAENDPYIQPINRTVDYVGVMPEIQPVDNTSTENNTNTTNTSFVITFSSNQTGISFIDKILDIIDNLKFSI